MYTKMSGSNEKCTKCHGDHETGSIYCPKLHDKRINDSNKISLTKSLDNSYIVQIVSIGIRPDHFYEAKMLLAPEVDMSSTKITVKGNNLRVSVLRRLRKDLLDIIEKSVSNDLTKLIIKHRENLLIPETIDSDEIRAVVDNKHRMLILTAPSIKPSKTRKM
ncbi:PREDICTED: uncharacterized protein LOC107066811 [Polistes dominula]|uniref:Uncharacterized protein LOC107066811 n=1 Tax=Polistes dominula TaxID=743375 RepID=A0ABM1IAM1_POLDO|nr:PREDICTED: uncharacterized protein LOC107066811 [Polistes dominula]